MRPPVPKRALGRLPPSLMRCLCTTNIIENPNGIVRTTTNRVKRWRDQDMALRWVPPGSWKPRSRSVALMVSRISGCWLLLWAASCRRAPSSEPRKVNQIATGANWPRDIGCADSPTNMVA